MVQIGTGRYQENRRIWEETGKEILWEERRVWRRFVP
jgi:hypothetical protein